MAKQCLLLLFAYQSQAHLLQSLAFQRHHDLGGFSEFNDT
jgi:hypothetical protein